jgi:hypothetical protein
MVEYTGGKEKGSFDVYIGDYHMNILQSPDSDDGPSRTGAPNPISLVWSKENSIATHKIPDPAFRTTRTSNVTLWTLNIEFHTMNKENADKIRKMIDAVGPLSVGTFLQSMMMYIEKGSASQNPGFDDEYITWNLTLLEARD